MEMFENMKAVMIHIKTASLCEDNLIFCCTGPINLNFWQIKIVVLISHINIFLTIYFSSNMIFSFGLQ